MPPENPSLCVYHVEANIYKNGATGIIVRALHIYQSNGIRLTVSRLSLNHKKTILWVFYSVKLMQVRHYYEIVFLWLK